MARAHNPRPLAVVPEGYGYPDARALAALALDASVAVMLRGHPGVGKSTLAAELARDAALPLIDIRLAQRDPAELGGVYFPDHASRTLTLLAPDWVRQACDAPALVFLDEINAATTRLHQAAAYQIVLERRVGPFRFHPGTRVMAAGNLADDQALATPLSAALANRFAHLTLRVDADAWLAWATAEGLAPELLAYVSRYGDPVLYEAPSDDGPSPSPRSWAMASALLASAPPDGPDATLRKRAVAACVGASAAERLWAFLTIFRRVNPARIIRRGEPMDFANGAEAEPSFLCAAVFAVAAWVADNTVEDAELPNVVAFARSPGVDPEYQLLFFKHLARRPLLMRRLKGLPSFRDLAAELVDLRVGWAR